MLNASAAYYLSPYANLNDTIKKESTKTLPNPWLRSINYILSSLCKNIGTMKRIVPYDFFFARQRARVNLLSNWAWTRPTFFFSHLGAKLRANDSYSYTYTHTVQLVFPFVLIYLLNHYFTFDLAQIVHVCGWHIRIESWDDF